MAIQVSDIRTELFLIAQEFYTEETTELTKINSLITNAMNRHSQSSLGSSFVSCIAYYVAHQLSLQGFKPASSSISSGSNSTQEITKKKAGNLEITYSSNTVKKTQSITSGFDANSYGSMYKSIMDNIIEAPIFLL